MKNYEDIRAINQSLLKCFHRPRSIAHAALAYERMRNNYNDTSKDELVFGRFVHSLVLEPHTVDSLYVVADKPDLRKKDAKEAWLALQENAKKQGKTIVSQDDYTTALSMRNAIARHRLASKILNADGNLFEEILVGQLYDSNGQPHNCKGRTDVVCSSFFDKKVIVDLKTTQDASPRGFAKSCADYGYYLQAAFYCDLLAAHLLHNKPTEEAIETFAARCLGFVFIAVEKQAPYGVAVYEASADMLRRGRLAYKAALSRFREYELAVAANEYPAGYPDDSMQELELPAWDC